MEFPFGGLRSRFWLRNEVFLSSIAEGVNAMESWNWGWCPRLM